MDGDGSINLGQMAFRMEGGALRHLRWRGVEVLRGLSVPVRDNSWSTLPEQDVTAAITQDGARWCYTRWFTVAGALKGILRIEADPAGRIEAALSITATRRFETNRAGFTLLHPLDGVVGRPAMARHPGGATSDFVFPNLIAPAQPALDLAGLDHDVHGVRVDIAFAGEVFEMEDQRNWSDASFKTYCRPLSRPLPQILETGDRIDQRVTLSVTGQPTAMQTQSEEAVGTVTMPEILLALRPGWQGGIKPGTTWPANGVLLRAGVGAAWLTTDLAALAAQLADRPLDLEVVTPPNDDPAPTLRAVGWQLAQAGLSPRHVVALPASYLRSIQPQGPWPSGPSPEDAAKAANDVFPNARLGVGMLTNFTELNRRPVTGGSFVTHANAAIVHAADDVSVLETLEALPDVMRSARFIAGNRAYRLGLMSIGMPDNPYGAGLSPNPDAERRTMTDADPRQRTTFSAFYATCVAAIVARAGAEAVALAAPAGPFGTDGPLADTLATLARMAGRCARLTGTPPGPVRIEADGIKLHAKNAETPPRAMHDTETP